ncbi:ABC transporter ATP-binding protein [Pseudotabrizicola algicola]|uniref:sn-glycerol-3-phosphate ABC transporter ATP-binding protein UgpC n=1 Tax=Pseudotabrizicola algicola TaxID=2709381 RepID=A0A6B3RVJ8_9RHOB|nr:sn-glycerol-3-phosphate ABC transporter ATP-binding protein UgpC [Pseudotabrizicola algicola]NEX48808.1 sn-glycerol-3-phosphate ABC transporter ATP-binding protein UgpC [Pseudotabrizicola algicola]
MLINLDGVSKAFGNYDVLRDISFGVPKGSFTILVGPSGCGKSTLLRMIAGIEDPTGGTISIAGRVVNDVEPKHRDIAMVFQNYALYPHMTVAQNMGFSLTMRATPKAEIAAAVARAADILGLTPLLDRKPSELSGGQRQRVAMGRAIVREPVAFLFDEPLSNLDAQLRGQMRAEIRALHRRLGATSIYVTHDQVEAMTMADQIVVLRAGRIEQIGAPLDLYDRPANSFVASFIGSPGMNLLRARATSDGALVVTGLDTPWTLPRPARLAPDQPVLLGVRPQHMVLTDAPDAPEIIVDSVEQMGAEQSIVARAGDQTVSLVVRDRRVITPGDRLRVTLEPEGLHLFDPDTGMRLAQDIWG